MPNHPEFLTAAEVAEILRTGPWTVMRLCRVGELRAIKPAKSWLIAPADLDAYIAAQANKAAS